MNLAESLWKSTEGQMQGINYAPSSTAAQAFAQSMTVEAREESEIVESPTWSVVKAQLGRAKEKAINLGAMLAGSSATEEDIAEFYADQIVTPANTKYPITPQMLSNANSVATTVSGIAIQLLPLAIPVAGAGAFVGLQATDRALEIGGESGFDVEKMQKAAIMDSVFNTAMLAIAPLSKAGVEAIQANGLLTRETAKEVGISLSKNIGLGAGSRWEYKQMLEEVNPALAKKVEVFGVTDVLMDAAMTLFISGMSAKQYRKTLKAAGATDEQINIATQMNEERLARNPEMADAVDTLRSDMSNTEVREVLAQANANKMDIDDYLATLNEPPKPEVMAANRAEVESLTGRDVVTDADVVVKPVEKPAEVVVPKVEIEAEPMVKIKTIDEAGTIKEVEMLAKEAIGSMESALKNITDIATCVAGE